MKTSKQLLKIAKKLNDEFAETDLQKAEMLYKYFASQSFVNDDNKVLPQLTRSVRFVLLSLLKILKMFLIILMLVSLVVLTPPKHFPCLYQGNAIL